MLGPARSAGEQVPHLLRLQLTPLARGEVAEVEAADADADELEDVVADRRAHPPDLAVLPLGEDDLEPGGPFTRAGALAETWRSEDAYLRRPRERAVVEGQAFAQRPQRLPV